MTTLSPPLQSYLGLGSLIDISSEEWLAEDFESEEAWLTPSKAAELLPPLAKHQDIASPEAHSGQLQRKGWGVSRKTPLPSTPDQAHYSSGAVSQEEEQPDTAITRSSGFQERYSGLSISSSPASPLSTNSISYGGGPGSTDSQAENQPSSLAGIGLSGAADESPRKSHSLQACDAAPWPITRSAHASGSSGGNSSSSEDLEMLSLDPYTVRHLCLQELELLWSEECSEGANDDSAEKHARDLVRSLQIASLLGKLRSAVGKVDEQLALTMAQMEESEETLQRETAELDDLSERLLCSL